jgi:glycosyltransferase involved in cell wall biosynthesis
VKILFIINRLGRGGAQRLLLDICMELNLRQNITYKVVCLESLNQYPEYTQKIPYFVSSNEVKLSIFSKNKIDVSNLQSLIDEFAPDIIHSHLFNSEIVSRSCYYPSAKWFSHCHGFFPELRKLSFDTFFSMKKLIRWYDMRYLKQRYIANGNNTYIAVSDPIKEYVLEGIKTQCYVLPNAIQFERFNKQHTARILSNQLKLISVGRFDENKNQIFLLEVIRKLLDAKIDVHLSLFGDGKTKSMLLAKVRSLEIEKNVSFMGFVNNIEDYYHQSHIYIHSAKKEALGLTLLEAMAAGLPVVSLDGVGNRNLINDGENGNMVKNQDAVGFANCVIEIWNDKHKYTEMSKNARNFSKNYDIHLYVDKLLSIYNSKVH